MRHLSTLVSLLALANVVPAVSIGRRHGSGIAARDAHAKLHNRQYYGDDAAAGQKGNVSPKDCPPEEVETTITVVQTITLPYPPGGIPPTEPTGEAPSPPSGTEGAVPQPPPAEPSGPSSPPSQPPTYGPGPGDGGSDDGSDEGSDDGDDTEEPSGPSPGDGSAFPPPPAGPVGKFWLEGVKHQGIAPFNKNFSVADYPVFRNVKEFGAKGDGVTDDTEAINAAIAKGNRCASGCDSTTVEPALVYFPAGTYLVSKPIVALYLSQLVGDPTNLPVLKASADFEGIAVVDSDPYNPDGSNFYFNTNNFFRAVRNFVIDLTAKQQGTGIHWQVAQASSLINIRFEMEKTESQGIFMDNGSGGFMSDLIFNGGKVGAFLGNQQFMTRNLTFNGCKTAVVMNWNWAWTFKSISVSNCEVGIDMTTGNKTNQNVGSILVQDSVFQNVPVGVKTLKDSASGPKTGGTLVLDNLKTNNVPLIVASNSSEPILQGSSGSTSVASWGQGRQYVGGDTAGKDFQAAIQTAPRKPKQLLDSNGAIFEKSRPQYENFPASAFLSARDAGAKGDGKTDDADALQKLINSCAANGKIVFIDYGVYMVSKTLNIPPGTRITGECWPVIMSFGQNFADETTPQPLIRVGKSGQKGAVELSDLIFSTQGPAPGAIVMEWNMADPVGAPGSNGMWDVHIRVGGAAGTKLQSDLCTKDPFGDGTPNPKCVSAFMLMHITKTASVYMENNWIWTSDHELDIPKFNQISIYSGRGIWIESQKGPVWMYATASEHNVFYQYQLTGASGVYMGMIQTETPYYQAKPIAPVPFKPQQAWMDPTFEECPQVAAGQNNTCAKAWGVRVVDSKDILIYGAGLYSFFENYDQECTKDETCQQNMISIEGENPNFFMYNLNTKGSTNMITINGKPSAAQKDNKNGFCETIAMFSSTGYR